MKIHIYNKQRALLFSLNSRRALRDSVQSILEYLEIETDEIAVYLVASAKITKLHAEFFNDPTPTDCITFPVDEEYLGEIFVCTEVAISYAHKKQLDPYDETLLYVVHGLLHLAGYDDLDPKRKRIMRKMEKSCMGHLKKQGISLKA